MTPWRTGRKVFRTIYDADDKLIGMMDTPELASQVVKAVSACINWIVADAVPLKPWPPWPPSDETDDALVDAAEASEVGAKRPERTGWVPPEQRQESK